MGSDKHSRRAANNGDDRLRPHVVRLSMDCPSDPISAARSWHLGERAYLEWIGLGFTGASESAPVARDHWQRPNEQRLRLGFISPRGRSSLRAERLYRFFDVDFDLGL